MPAMRILVRARFSASDLALISRPTPFAPVYAAAAIRWLMGTSLGPPQCHAWTRIHVDRIPRRIADKCVVVNRGTDGEPGQDGVVHRHAQLQLEIGEGLVPDALVHDSQTAL